MISPPCSDVTEVLDRSVENSTLPVTAWYVKTFVKVSTSISEGTDLKASFVGTKIVRSATLSTVEAREAFVRASTADVRPAA